MNGVFKKLQLKDQDRIYVLGAPREFRPHLDEVSEVTQVKKSPNCKQRYGFALFFVKSCADIEKVAPRAADKIEGDGLLWFAYPKKSSPNYRSDISRDDGWKSLGDLGFEGVRQVAIDDDWSALRFRHVDHIKRLTREPKRAVSKKDKKRTK